MFVRYASAVTSGTAMTLGLFYLMQSLIDMGPTVEVPPQPRIDIGWIKFKQDEELITEEWQEIDKSPIDPPPIPDRVTEYDDAGVITVTKTPVTAPAQGSTKFDAAVFSDGPLVTMVRVQPVYPPRAEAKRLEGYVIVQFDVLANGTVDNISIVESSNSVFHSAAVKATQKFRFKPRVLDGIAQPTSGLQNLFRFEMNK